MSCATEYRLAGNKQRSAERRHQWRVYTSMALQRFPVPAAKQQNNYYIDQPSQTLSEVSND